MNNINKIKGSILVTLILAFCIQLFSPIETFAQDEQITTKALDTYSKNHVHVFSYTKNFTSLSPDVGSEGMPAEYKKVSFDVVLNATTQHDRVTGKYVSASTPTAVLSYVGPVNLGLNNVSTSKRDNGNSVTFTYSADVYGIVTVMNVPIRITYGRVSDSFTVSK